MKIDHECTDQVLPAHFDRFHWRTMKKSLMTTEGRLGDLARLLETNVPKDATVTLFGISLDNCCGLIRHEVSPSKIHYHLFPCSGSQKRDPTANSTDLISFHVLLFSFLTLWLWIFS
ncbi:hypothetical protein P691DRAFT_240051 [Macrolepiota fuliginosa MF-IS2]|uniref:Uncharacterized protein n=1 Tax=Macrolepiota fuliginosa MF-IS2 TaxID=1400762 RepID=A0A9P5X7I9_9AGAR|nr:hypothetical protein P691DRAFT_240051 [Macrolepiota fuliginosa MF-IS2]